MVEINEPGWTPIEWAVVAMNDAADRLSRVEYSDPRAAFAALGETLWWIVVVDNSLSMGSATGPAYKAQRAGDLRAGPILTGLRHARNRFAHDVDILEYVDPAALLDGDRRGYKTVWRWRSLPPTTKGRSGDGAPEYEEHLAGRDVHSCFIEVLTFLRGATSSRLS